MDLLNTDQYIILSNLEAILLHDENPGNPNIKKYDNLISVIGDQPELTFNRILSVKPEVYKFYNELTSLQKGMMVPKIEIYKKNKKNEDVPITFASYFDSKEYEEFILNSEILNKDFTKKDGVGLKSIEISERSERPSDTNISCKLNLYFDSILSLSNSNFLELIKSPELRTSDKSIDFRIKLVVGWQAPNDSKGDIFSPEMIKIVEESNIVYLLELVTHNISLKENGSIDLTIEYQGALEKHFSTSRNMDILDITSIDKMKIFFKDLDLTSDVAKQMNPYVQAITEKEIISKDLEKLYEFSGKNESVLTEENQKSGNKKLDDKIAELESKAKEIDDRIASLEFYIIKHKYSRILNSVLKNGNIYYLTMPIEAYKTLAAPNKLDDNFDPQAFIQINISQPKKVNLGGSIANRNKNYQNILEALNKTLEDFKSKSEESLVKDANIEDLDDIQPFGPTRPNRGLNLFEALPKYLEQKNGIENISSNFFQKYIYYISLGNLLDAVMSFCINQDDMDILIGPCKIGNTVLNLTDIPISISNFSVWFINKVIKTSRKKYFVWEFIQDIFRDLVIPNLAGLKIFKDISTNLVVSTTTVISDKKLERGQKYIDKSLISNLSRNVFNTKDVYSYLVIYVYDYRLARRDAIEEEDLKDGIFHFGIGRDKGVLKQAEFKKIDFPRLRDMRLTDNSLNNPGNLLREHYNMSLKVIGCPLFINAGITYFDGSFLGLLGRKITENIGLGGYYLTTGINTTISQDTYEMNVETMWQSMRINSEENQARINGIKNYK